MVADLVTLQAQEPARKDVYEAAISKMLDDLVAFDEILEPQPREQPKDVEDLSEDLRPDEVDLEMEITEELDHDWFDSVVQLVTPSSNKPEQKEASLNYDQVQSRLAAVYKVQDRWHTLVIFDPARLTPSSTFNVLNSVVNMLNSVVAAIRFVIAVREEGVAVVSRSAAEHGYGPFLYDLSMTLAVKAGAKGLTSDRRTVSAEAQQLWEYYFTRRPDVTKIPLTREDGSAIYTKHMTAPDDSYLNYMYSLTHEINISPRMLKRGESKLKSVFSDRWDFNYAKSSLIEHGPKYLQEQLEHKRGRKKKEASPAWVEKEVATASAVFASPRYRQKGLKENPVPSGLAAIEKYVDQPGVYFHMSELGPGGSQDRLGINPHYGEHSTPTGLYGYPLTKEMYDALRQHDSKKLPYREEARYVHVFRIKPQYKNRLLDIGEYTASQFKQDYDKLLRLAVTGSFPGLKKDPLNSFKHVTTSSSIARLFDTAIAEAEPEGLESAKLWNITRAISLASANKIERDVDEYDEESFTIPSEGSRPTIWTKLLQALGYVGATDPGKGLIHRNEPAQCVIFDGRTYERIAVEKNPAKEFDEKHKARHTKARKIVQSIDRIRKNPETERKVLDYVFQHTADNVTVKRLLQGISLDGVNYVLNKHAILDIVVQQLSLAEALMIRPDSDKFAARLWSAVREAYNSDALPVGLQRVLQLLPFKLRFEVVLRELKRRQDVHSAKYLFNVILGEKLFNDGINRYLRTARRLLDTISGSDNYAHVKKVIFSFAAHSVGNLAGNQDSASVFWDLLLAYPDHALQMLADHPDLHSSNTVSTVSKFLQLLATKPDLSSLDDAHRADIYAALLDKVSVFERKTPEQVGRYAQLLSRFALKAVDALDLSINEEKQIAHKLLLTLVRTYHGLISIPSEEMFGKKHLKEVLKVLKEKGFESPEVVTASPKYKKKGYNKAMAAKASTT